MLPHTIGGPDSGRRALGMRMGGGHGSQQVVVGSGVAYSVAWSFANDGGGGVGVPADGNMSFACVPVYHGEFGEKKSFNPGAVL